MRLFGAGLVVTFLGTCSAMAPPKQSIPSHSRYDLTRLFSRIWHVTNAPSKPAPGSIYIFLANGTMLQTSCGETYRVATWTIDKKAPSVLRVVEDHRLAFTAVITELTDNTLRLQQSLVRSKEKRTIEMKAVPGELLCSGQHE